MATPTPSPAPELQRAKTQLAGAAPLTEPGEDPVIGTVVADRYRLLERVGTGGMGAVYRGEHVALRKRVAVKFLHAELSRITDVVARFEREAVAAAHLEHPNVVAATDFGKTSEGLFFLVMEFVDGGSLRDLLNTEKILSPPRAVHIARHIAAALHRAHALGIVHRDLKPENVVLVEREGDPDFAKVIDFGIAKVSPERMGTGPAITQAGMVFGTPDYMAPEQALGSKIDQRADLYAFGIMVFEMLTGRRPFESDDVMSLLGKHMTAPPPSASATAPTGTLPPSVDPVFTKILAKSPNDRFGSAQEFIIALETALGMSGLPFSTGLTPAFGVQIPVPAMITGGYPASRASSPSVQFTGLGAADRPSSPKQPRSFGVPPRVTDAIEALRPIATRAGREAARLSLEGAEAVRSSYAALRADPRRRRIAIGIGGGVVAVLAVTALATRSASNTHRPTDVTPLAASTRRDARSDSNSAARRESHVVAAPRASTPDTSGTQSPSALAAQVAAYRAQPDVAALMAAARGRQLRLVTTAFEQTRERTPSDAIVTYLLGTLYARERRTIPLALQRYAEALRMQPAFASDATLVHDVARIFAESRRPPDQAAAMLQGTLAGSAVTALLDIALDARQSNVRSRAAGLLSVPPLSLRVDDTQRELLALGTARACAAKREIVERLGHRGDARALPYLRRIPLGGGCGFFGLEQCNPCLTTAVPAAIQAIESRAQ